LWIDEKIFISHKVDAANNSTIVYVITECPYVERGADYLEKKDEYVDGLLKKVTELYPALKNYDAFDAATPATAEKWLGSEKGCSYGLSQPAARFGDFDVIRALRPTTSVKGLFLVGQDSMFWGVVGALASGWICAQDILTPNPLSMFIGGPNIMKDLVNEYVKIRKSEKEIEEAAKKQ
jgi:phytoene dehydrogenase-like protein